MENETYRFLVKMKLSGSFNARKYLARSFSNETFVVILYDKVRNEPLAITEDYDGETETKIPFLGGRDENDFEYQFLYNGKKSPLHAAQIVEGISDSVLSYQIEYDS